MASRISRCGKHPILVANPKQARFSYSALKSGSVMISSNGVMVKTLDKTDARKFFDKVSAMSNTEAQLLMAKITGQFKFGNEREGKLHET